MYLKFRRQMFLIHFVRPFLIHNNSVWRVRWFTDESFYKLQLHIFKFNEHHNEFDYTYRKSHSVAKKVGLSTDLIVQ